MSKPEGEISTGSSRLGAKSSRTSGAHNTQHARGNYDLFLHVNSKYNSNMLFSASKFPSVGRSPSRVFVESLCFFPPFIQQNSDGLRARTARKTGIAVVTQLRLQFVVVKRKRVRCLFSKPLTVMESWTVLQPGLVSSKRVEFLA